MTNLNYSNLPKEAQEAIQKLTGLAHDKLEGKTTDEIAGITEKGQIYHKKPLRVSLKTMVAFLIIILACWGIIALIFLTCAR